MYILLFCFWLLLAGRVTWEILGLGLVLTCAMGALEYLLFGYKPASEVRLWRKAPVFLAYLGILVWEILKASAAVLTIIVFRAKKVKPTLVTFRVSPKTEFGRFLLANSITLTPGTITISAEDDRFTVHCLDRSMLDTSPDSRFQKWIRRLEA